MVCDWTDRTDKVHISLTTHGDFELIWVLICWCEVYLSYLCCSQTYLCFVDIKRWHFIFEIPRGIGGHTWAVRYELPCDVVKGRCLHVSVWQNDFTCADYLRECGEKFIAADHYAVDCIRPKCGELQRICEEFNERLSHRRRSLEISRKLHQHIDKVPLSSVFSYWHQLCMAWAHKTLLLKAVEFTVSKLTIWCPLLSYGYMYKTLCGTLD